MFLSHWQLELDEEKLIDGIRSDIISVIINIFLLFFA